MSTTPSELPVPPGVHRTHPFNVALGAAGIAFGAFLGFVLEGVGLQLFLSILGAREVASWWFRTYDVRPDEILISEGILTRHSRVVPYGRIQQVDVRQGLIAQVLGLASLRIETAGSRAGRVDLSLLDRPTAERLRAFALARRAALQDKDPAAEPRAHDVDAPSAVRPLLTLDGARLLLAGATNDLAVAVTAAVIPVLLVGIPIEIAAGVDPWVVALTVVLALGVPILFVLFGAIGTTLTFARFALTVHDKDLRVDYGVFQVAHLTVPRRRVQLISVTDNPLRRALGFAAVDLHSAAPEGGGEDAAGRLTIPLVARQHVPALLVALMDDPSWQVPSLLPRPTASRRRGVVRRALGLVAPVLITAVVAFPIGLVALLVVPAAVPWGLAAHARAGHGVTAEMTAFASGVLRHRVELIPHRRVQSARQRASWFQRRVMLATLALDVAARGAHPRLYDMDSTTAGDLRTTIPRLSSPVQGTTTISPSMP